MNKMELYNDPDGWGIVHTDIYSVDEMSDAEICMAILDDLLIAQSWEINLKWYDIFRFLPIPNKKFSLHNDNQHRKDRIDKVFNLLISDAVYPLIIIDNEDNIYIKQEKTILQYVMNLVGFWLDGYEIPEGTEVIKFTTKGRELIESMNINDFTKLMMMKLGTLHEESKIIN